MVVDSLIKASAVGGVAALWSYFTLKTVWLWGHFTHETLKICEKIFFPPQFYRCEKCRNYFTKELFSSSGICKFCAEKNILCDECSERFLDN